MDAKERIRKAMHQEPTDRPPCICPGGMMNMITTDLMDEANVSWPEAHLNARMMADLAEANYEKGCFENVGVPFCMTIEAEAMGAQVTMGSKIYEPHVTGYAINSVTEWETITPMSMEEGRAKVVLDAIRILKSRNLDVPIIGNITGPVSTASSVMEPVIFYKELRKKKEEAHRYMQFVTDEIIKFARAQIDAMKEEHRQWQSVLNDDAQIKALVVEHNLFSTFINLMQESFDPVKQTLSPHQNSILEDSGFMDFSENDRSILELAGYLALGYIHEATNYVNSHSGSSSSLSGWGRKKDEDDEQWWRRSIRTAASAMKPARRMGRRR